MKFYLLKRRLPFRGPSHDVALGFLVYAKNADHARTIASERKGDEPGDTWMNASFSSCVELNEEITGDPRVLLRDFNAG